MKHGRNPVTRSVVAEEPRMRRVLRTPPTKASQTDVPRPFREAKGARKSEANFAGMPVQDPSEWSSIRQTSFRIVGRKRLQHQREEQSSDDGGSSFTPCLPEGRRSGDVGGAGTKHLPA